jgi:putative DNA methylase
MSRRKKLIEVALPLEAINLESAREKSIRHGHPSTLHLWWARKPLAACRAVLWASLVDDPSSWPDKFPTEADQERERQRLFNILGRIEIEQGKRVVRGLVSWDDVNNPNSGVLEAAQREIARCLAWDRGEEPPTDPAAVREYIAKYAPPVYDPFAGGGSIPLEAQRLGLEAHASDLNPVAVLINKALIEIPPKFKDKAPINPEDRAKKHISAWRGAQGLAADVRYYGAWMRKQAFERIGHLYPSYSNPIRVSGTESIRASGAEHFRATRTESLGAEELTVIAWLWARTVTCPNPACRCQMPLVRSFQLSTKKGKEVWVEPVVVNGGESASAPSIRFVVRSGKGKAPEGTVGRKGARCIACGTPVPLEYIRKEGQARRMGSQMMAIVAEGPNGRVYLDPTAEQEAIAHAAQPTWKPDTELPKEALGFRVQNYGMTKHADLFTPRQLVALTTFSDLVAEAREKAIADAKVLRTADATAAGLPDDDVPLAEGGTGARAYGEAISVYLAFAVDRLADFNSTSCGWIPVVQATRNTFARQALPMTWDYAELNPFGDWLANYEACLDKIIKPIEVSIQSVITSGTQKSGISSQHDATAPHPHDTTPKLISTDPPYYDAVPYADLSDFFYVWLRRSLYSIYSNIFNTVLVPKAQEMVADHFRHGSKERAKEFFEASLIKVFQRVNHLNHPDYPVTVYYALKQTEEDSSSPDSLSQVEQGEEDEDIDDPVPLSPSGRRARGVRVSGTEPMGRVSTGWETILEGLIQSNFSIDGTWPLRTELANRMRAQDSNALASSIVLVCRPRPADAPKATRRQFLAELKRELPKALKLLQQGSIAPVDLAQASIGPGMAIYSRYAAVLESDGSPLTVRTALQLINQYLDEYLSEQEGELDEGSRWATTWFAQYQFEPGPYGEAEVLSKARNVSIESLEELGILEAKAGKVRLLRREEIAQRKEKGADSLSLLLASSAWLITQTLIHTLDQKGEMEAAALLAALGDRGAVARDLAYRLYTLCDKKGWTQEALAYNTLVIAWPEINRLASEMKKKQHDPFQPSLL